MADDSIVHSDTPVANAVEIADGNNNWIPDAQDQTQVNADLAAGVAAHDHAVADTATAQQLTSDLGAITGNTNQDKLNRATITSERQNYRDASYGLQAEAVAYGAAANAYQPPVVAATPAPTAPPAGMVTSTIGSGTTVVPNSPIEPASTTPLSSTPVPVASSPTVTAASPTSSPASAAATDTAISAASSTATSSNAVDPAKAAAASDSATAAASSTAINSNAADDLPFIKVKAGDTLTSIAAANNVPLSSLEAANKANVPDPSMIYVNQKIYLPSEGSATVVNTTPANQNVLGGIGGATTAADDMVKSAINGGHDSTDIADKGFKRQ
jgi:LysM repeat protein